LLSVGVITANLIYFAGAEDEQFEEEKELIMKEIERVSGFANS